MGFRKSVKLMDGCTSTSFFVKPNCIYIFKKWWYLSSSTYWVSSQEFFKIKKPSWGFTLFKALEVGLYHNSRLPSIFCFKGLYSGEAHGDHTYRIKHWNDHHLKRFVIHLKKEAFFFLGVKLRSLLSNSWFQKELWTSILTFF
jgi:hypothetical protein